MDQIALQLQKQIARFSAIDHLRKLKDEQQAILRVLEDEVFPDEISFVFDHDPPKPHPPIRRVVNGCVTVRHYKSEEVARQLCLIEFDYFRQIQPKECLNQAWNAENKEIRAPQLTAMIVRFNEMSRFVQYTILQCQDSQERAKFLIKWIKVAQKCNLLGNLNGLMEIYAGLTSSPVYNLKRTWALVPPKWKNIFSELETLLSRAGNFKNLRQRMKSAACPCIPYIGLFLSDLTFVDVGNRSEVNGMINFSKRMMLADIINEIRLFQQQPFLYKPVNQLQELLLHLSCPLDDKALMELSLLRDQRSLTLSSGSLASSSSSSPLL